MNNLTEELASLRIDHERTPADSKKRARRRWRWLWAAAGLVLAVSLGLRGLVGGVAVPEVVLTEISVATPKQSSLVLTASGYVVPQVVSKVGAKVAGRIARVLVREGDVARAGDLLAQVDDSTQRAAMAAAISRAAVVQARADAVRASFAEVRLQAERAHALEAAGAVTRATVEDLEARMRQLAEEVRAAKAEVTAARAEIELLRVGLQDHAIVAPIDGTITTRPVAVGELVGPEVKVAEIVDFGSLMVEADVPEARLGDIRLGMPCEIVLEAVPARRYRGIAVGIGRTVNRAKASVTVKVKFVDRPDKILPEMSARTSFLNEALPEATSMMTSQKVVPRTAVREFGGTTTVFVSEGNRARRQAVKLGKRLGDVVEIVDGPPVGTRILADPPSALDDGQIVKEIVR